MIQEIAPHKFDLTYGQPKAQDEDFVLFIKKSKTLLRKTAEENHEIPKFSDFQEDKEALKEHAYYLFAIDGDDPPRGHGGSWPEGQKYPLL